MIRNVSASLSLLKQLKVSWKNHKDTKYISKQSLIPESRLKLVEGHVVYEESGTRVGFGWKFCLKLKWLTRQTIRWVRSILWTMIPAKPRESPRNAADYLLCTTTTTARLSWLSRWAQALLVRSNDFNLVLLSLSHFSAKRFAPSLRHLCIISTARTNWASSVCSTIEWRIWRCTRPATLKTFVQFCRFASL